MIMPVNATDGIDYAGMMTDQQHMGYVCHLGESGPPQVSRSCEPRQPASCARACVRA